VRNLDRSLGDGGMPLLGDLGVSFTKYGEGWAEAEWTPTELACNPMGAVHGGTYAVIHDATMNFSAMSALDKGDRAVTIAISYTTMRASAAGDARAVRGDVVRVTRSLAYVETVVTDAHGERISSATGQFILRRKEQ
jgi:uncharacterized protein (TIGR00369 family)